MNGFSNVFGKGQSAVLAALAVVACAVAIACAPALAYADDSKPLSPEDEPATINMFRLYNPNSGEHFYTADVNEKVHLIDVGWRYEGVGWRAPATGRDVFRLYNANAGDHHYTMDVDERDHLVDVGWTYEGVGWYSDEGERVPLYRQYNPNAVTGTHNYTTSAYENDHLVSVGWRAENVGWYGIGTSAGQWKIVAVESAWDEPVYETRYYCDGCGADVTKTGFMAHLEAGCPENGHFVHGGDVCVDTIHHDAVYGWEWVPDPRSHDGWL